MVEDENERSVHSTVLLLLGTFSILRFERTGNQIAILRDAHERKLAGRKEKNLSPYSNFSSATRLAIFNWSRRAVGKRSGYSRKIYNNHSARRTTNIQRRINRWSSAGFFSAPPPLLFLSRILGIRVDSGNLRNEFDRARSVVGWNIFIYRCGFRSTFSVCTNDNFNRVKLNNQFREIHVSNKRRKRMGDRRMHYLYRK